MTCPAGRTQAAVDQIGQCFQVLTSGDPGNPADARRKDE